jgi:hypothetical protein
MSVPSAPSGQTIKTSVRTLVSVLIIALFVGEPILLIATPTDAKASDWSETIGNILKEQKWGFGSTVNLTLNKTGLTSGKIKLNMTSASINTTLSDLNSGTKTNITITRFDSLVLTSKGPYWSRKSGWDLPTIPSPRRFAVPAFGDMDNDGDYDAYIGMENGTAGYYNNTGTKKTPSWTAKYAWNLSAASTSFAIPALADLDNDGDLDMLVGDNDGKCFGWENTGDKTLPKWTRKTAWDTPDIGGGAGPTLGDLDGDGDYDVIVGDGGGTSNAMKNTGTKNSPAWTNQTTWNPPLINNVVIKGALGDLDLDGDLDYSGGLGWSSGGNSGTTRMYNNTGDASGPTWARNTNWETNMVDLGDYTSPSFADLDGDGDLDLMIGEYLGGDYAYENLGLKPPTGNFYSKALDAGSYVNWSQVKWSETLPANTDVTIYVRTGNSTDPTDGSWSAWSAALSTPGGTVIPSPPARRIQIRAYLTSTNNHATPICWGMNVTYNHYEWNGAITTKDIAPSDLVSWNNMTATFDAKGETVKLYYSTNLGSTWTLVPANGNLTSISTASGSIRFRANFTTTRPNVTPELTGFSLKYMTLLAAHHLHIAPATVNVTVNGTYKFIAELHDINNNTLNKTLTWSTNIGTITTDGNFTARKTPGMGYVNVTYLTLKASVIVTVKVGPLSRLVVDPTALETEVGKNRTFNATGYDVFDNKLSGLTINWSSDIGTVAPTQGASTLFTARKTPGTGYVNVTSRSIKAGANITVKAGPVSRITVDPVSIVTEGGKNHTINATGFDAFDNKLSGLTFNWSSDKGNVTPAQGASTTYTAWIPPKGTYTNTSGNISAAIGSIKATVNVTILGYAKPPPEKPVLTKITISPINATLKKGDTLQFTGSGLDQFNNTMSVTFNWSSDVGSMSPAEGAASTLTVTIEQGNGTVSATIGTISASAPIRVTKTGSNNNTTVLPFIKGRIPDQWRSEDSPAWTLDLQPFEGGGAINEDLVWHIEGMDTSIVKVTGEYGSSDVLTFTTVPQANGNFKTSMVLEDHNNHRAVQSVWFNITPVNDPPMIRPVPDLLIHYDSSYTFNYKPYIFDIDTPYSGLTLSISATDPATTQLTTSIGELNVTYNAPKDMMGKMVRVTLALSDGTTTVKNMIAVNVSDDWIPKLAVPLPDVTMREGETKYSVFDLDDHFTDQDKDVIFYTYGNNHVTIIIHPEHTVDIAATSQWSGQELVTFRATDSKGGLVEDDVLVTVIPSNDPPTIGALPDITIHYESDFQLDLLPYINDPDTAPENLVLTFSDAHAWWAWDPIKAPDHPPRAGASRLTTIMNYPQVLGMSVAPYTVVIKITVSDGTNSANGTLKVTVSNNWPPVLRAPLPDLEMDEDTVLTNTLRLSGYFSDPDAGPLTYKVVSQILTVTVKSDSNVDISTPKDWSGLTTITFRAQDASGAMVEDTINVKVKPVNDAPVLDALTSQSMDEKALLTVPLSTKIHDVDNSISELKISVSTSNPLLRYFMSGSDVVLYGDKAGNYTVTITVTDPAGASDSKTFNVDIKSVTKPVTKPKLGLDSMLLSFVIILLVLIGLIAAFAAYRRQYGHYDIDDAFVVMRDGRLISHLSKHPITKKDEVVFSSMVAALQMFVEDAFKDMDDDMSGSVQRMEFKGNNILVEKGRHMYLALLFSGNPGKKLYSDMTSVLETIEDKHSSTIRDWDGDVTHFGDLPHYLMKFVPGGYTKPIKIDNEDKKRWDKADQDDIPVAKAKKAK